MTSLSTLQQQHLGKLSFSIANPVNKRGIFICLVMKSTNKGVRLNCIQTACQIAMRFFTSKMQLSFCNCFKQSLCFSCQQYLGFWPYYRWVAGGGGQNITKQHNPEHAHVVPLNRVQGLILTPQPIHYCAKQWPHSQRAIVVPGRSRSLLGDVHFLLCPFPLCQLLKLCVFEK